VASPVVGKLWWEEENKMAEDKKVYKTPPENFSKIVRALKELVYGKVDTELSSGTRAMIPELDALGLVVCVRVDDSLVYVDATTKGFNIASTNVITGTVSYSGGLQDVPWSSDWHVDWR
jgi:hypothetical protein